jgi:hypothetical protein
MANGPPKKTFLYGFQENTQKKNCSAIEKLPRKIGFFWQTPFLGGRFTKVKSTFFKSV